MANTPMLSDKLFAVGSMLGSDGSSTYTPTFRQSSAYRGSAGQMPQPQQRGGGLNSALSSIGGQAGNALKLYQSGLLGSGAAAGSTGGALGSSAATGAATVGEGIAPFSSTALPSAASMGFGGGAAAGGGAAGAGAGGSAAGGATSALMSNPWTALAAAIVGSANYLDNKGISSWGDTLKGQAGGNVLDYYGGRDDGKTHGFVGKLLDQDGATGKSMKGITDFSELDFKNGIKNSLDAAKSALKLKFF